LFRAQNFHAAPARGCGALRSRSRAGAVVGRAPPASGPGESIRMPADPDLDALRLREYSLPPLASCECSAQRVSAAQQRTQLGEIGTTDAKTRKQR
jgi:hypothetical protein